MMEWALLHEPAIRFSAFVGVLTTVALWEVLAARRRLRASKARRWFANLTLVALNTIILRLLFPTAGVGAAVLASQRSWGLLHLVDIPTPVAIVAAIIALDLAIYLQHVMFHAVPILWRLHRVHHADPDFDVTTGARFHPIEIVLSMGIKLGVIVALGPEPIAVLAFEILLNATAMFNHGNLRLPEALDRILRWLVVTPDMHRVHHSRVPSEANSNYGFNLPWWDRLLGTYKRQPAAGHAGMDIGVEDITLPDAGRIHTMLALPFIHRRGRYAINERWRAQS